MRKALLFLFSVVLLFIFPHTNYSQEESVDPNAFPNVIPPSPEAASLGKYGDIPVGLYTGVPNIDIPLYTLKGKSIAVPISLSYHSGGIKVEEISSSVGIGWSLNAGGSITRSVRGLPDESAFGYFLTVQSIPLPYVPNTGDDSEYNTMELVAKNKRDLQPDVFYFNFLGKSGKFHFDNSGQIRLETEADIRIDKPASNWESSTWTIYDEDGTRYVFGGVGAVETNQIMIPDQIDEMPYPSAWNLIKIISTNGEEINFSYYMEDYQNDIKVSETEYIKNSIACNSLSDDISYMYQTTFTPYLQSISSSAGVVQFYFGTNRQDLPGAPELDRITVDDIEIILQQSYFTSSDFCTGWPGPSSEHLRKRLKLNGVEIRSISNPNDDQVYSFEYNETQNLPARCSYSQDHWGYYNGKNNSCLFPDFPGEEWPLGTCIADRDVDARFISANVLKAITYPTGGKTHFEYEPHSFQAMEETFRDKSLQLSLYDASVGDTESGLFSINYEQNVLISYSIINNIIPPGESPGAYICIHERGSGDCYSSNEFLTVQHGDTYSTIIEDLPAGLYEIILANPDMPGTDIEANLYYSESLGQNLVTKRYGGLRIASLKNEVGGSIELEKYYEYEQPHVVAPISASYYYYTWRNVVITSGNCRDLGYATKDCNYRVRKSNNQASLGTARGSNVVYGKVTVNYGPNAENGSEISEFNYSADVGGGAFPFPPHESNEWQRGYLVRHRIFDSGGNPVKKTENTFQFDGNTLTYGLKGGILREDPCRNTWAANDLILLHFFTRGGNAKKTQTIETTYGVVTGGDSLKVITNYGYNNNHHQVVSTSTTDSNGKTILTEFRYPDDYTSITASTHTIRKMKSDSYHLPAALIEQRSSLGGVFVSGNINKYYFKTNPAGSLGFYKNGIYIFDDNSGISSLPWQSDPTNPTLTYHYEFGTIEYDTYGNLQSTQKKNDLTTVYLYSYGNLYPVAKIDNATFTEVQNSVASTSASFINDLRNLTNQSSINTKLAQLRLEITNDLPKALITTYTFEKLKGVTSQTDPAGIITYYDYDDFGRLKNVKDSDGNILNHTEYHYAE